MVALELGVAFPDHIACGLVETNPLAVTLPIPENTCPPNAVENASAFIPALFVLILTLLAVTSRELNIEPVAYANDKPSVITLAVPETLAESVLVLILSAVNVALALIDAGLC